MRCSRTLSIVLSFLVLVGTASSCKFTQTSTSGDDVMGKVEKVGSKESSTNQTQQKVQDSFTEEIPALIKSTYSDLVFCE